jgi:hypothetical protein
MIKNEPIEDVGDFGTRRKTSSSNSCCCPNCLLLVLGLKNPQALFLAVNVHLPLPSINKKSGAVFNIVIIVIPSAVFLIEVGMAKSNNDRL